MRLASTKLLVVSVFFGTTAVLLAKDNSGLAQSNAIKTNLELPSEYWQEVPLENDESGMFKQAWADLGIGCYALAVRTKTDLSVQGDKFIDGVTTALSDIGYTLKPEAPKSKGEKLGSSAGQEAAQRFSLHFPQNSSPSLQGTLSVLMQQASTNHHLAAFSCQWNRREADSCQRQCEQLHHNFSKAFRSQAQ